MTEKKDLSLDEVKDKAMEEKIEVVEKEDAIQVEQKEVKEEVLTSKEPIIETGLADYRLLAKNFYASFSRRALAYGIDLFIVSALARLLSLVTFGVLETGGLSIIEASVDVLLVHFIYFVFMTYKYGQTLGKMILGIKVETNTGISLKLLDVIYREVVGRLINTIIWLTYLVPLFNSKKKGIHDYIADTVVIKEEYSELRRKVNESLIK